VIKIRLTEVQIKMYTFYLNNLARAAQVNKGASLFSDYQNLQRVWTHPLVMQLRADREEDKIVIFVF
jgi:transcriptional regulator ATRX